MSSISSGTTTTTALVQTADTSGVLQLQTNGGTTAVTIDTAQNVGIGTTSPSSQIHINGNSDNLFTAGFRVNRYTTAGQYGTVNYASGTFNITAVDTALSSPAITFRRSTDGSTTTESARIDSSGNVLVGTTSYSDGSLFKTTNVTALNAYRAQSIAANGAFAVYSDVGGTQTIRAYFRSDGGLANYSANNVNLSDENLKKDIALAGNYLSKICAIPVKNFRYKDQSESEDITLGVIAQDVLAVAPELVSQEGFGTNEEDKQNYLSIYQTDLQYALMKCIQELSAQVTTLQTQVTALKG